MLNILKWKPIILLWHEVWRQQINTHYITHAHHFQKSCKKKKKFFSFTSHIDSNNSSVNYLKWKTETSSLNTKTWHPSIIANNLSKGKTPRDTTMVILKRKKKSSLSLTACGKRRHSVMGSVKKVYLYHCITSFNKSIMALSLGKNSWWLVENAT